MLRERQAAAEVAGVFEPRIVAFLCNWCTYLAADLAGTSRMAYPPNVRVIRVMCSGRVDPQFVLKAFADGADGVFVGGCHPGDCHYQEGNYKALRRVRLLGRLLEQLGIERQRFRLEWISASEADKLRDTIGDMVAELRARGPARRTAPDEALPEDSQRHIAGDEVSPDAAVLRGDAGAALEEVTVQ